jgi:uncharacterized iron-regulated membrane protein
MNFAKIRRSLFVVHMWIGLVLGVLLAVLGISGSILVYDDAIADLLAPPPHAEAQGRPLPLDAVIAAARIAAHVERGAVTVTPGGPGEAALVRVGAPARPGNGPEAARDGGGRDGGRDGGGRGAQSRDGGGQARDGAQARDSGGPGAQANRGVQVYVDPVSGKVLGTAQMSLPPVLAFAHQLHGNFLMGRGGRSFVGWLGVAMLILGVSGLVLWWPKRGQWKYAFLVRRTAKGLRFHRELHAMAGIWTFVVFMIVSFSGVAIVFPETVRAMVGEQPAAQPAFNFRDGPAVTPQRGSTIGADAAVALAQKALPEGTLRSITLPARRTQAISVSMFGSWGGNANVWIDPWSGAVLGVNDPLANGDIMAWQRPLHQGAGLGAIWRFLVFLAGFMPALFVATGITMWLKKRQSRISMSAPLVGEMAR